MYRVYCLSLTFHLKIQKKKKKKWHGKNLNDYCLKQKLQQLIVIVFIQNVVYLVTKASSVSEE